MAPLRRQQLCAQLLPLLPALLPVLLEAMAQGRRRLPMAVHQLSQHLLVMQIPQATLRPAQSADPTLSRFPQPVPQGLQAVAHLLDALAQLMQVAVARIGCEPAGMQEATAAAGLQPFPQPLLQGQLTKPAVAGLAAPSIQPLEQLAGAFGTELGAEFSHGLMALAFKRLQQGGAGLAITSRQPWEQSLFQTLPQHIGIPTAAGGARQRRDPGAIQPRRQLQGGTELTEQ